MKKLFYIFLFLICSFYSFCSPQNPQDPQEPQNYEQQRKRMVKNDIEGRGIKDQRVLNAMLKIPRHLFVPERNRKFAYADHPLPIDAGQTISQPYVVALMTEAVELKSSDRVLEIGTGSGYQAAVLAEISKEVFSIEIKKALAESADKLLKKLKYKNVQVKHGDGYFGWKKFAPFDVIIITAATNKLPPPLVEQLKEGGRLILPLGKINYYQTLTVFKKKKNKIKKEEIIPVRFVPMTGKARE